MFHCLIILQWKKATVKELYTKNQKNSVHNKRLRSHDLKNCYNDFKVSDLRDVLSLITVFTSLAWTSGWGTVIVGGGELKQNFGCHWHFRTLEEQKIIIFVHYPPVHVINSNGVSCTSEVQHLLLNGKNYVDVEQNR